MAWAGFLLFLVGTGCSKRDGSQMSAMSATPEATSGQSGGRSTANVAAAAPAGSGMGAASGVGAGNSSPSVAGTQATPTAGASGSGPASPTAADGGVSGAGMPAASGAGTAAGAAGTGDVKPTAPNVWRSMGYDEKNWYFNPAEHTLSVNNAARLEEKWRFTVSGLPLGSNVVAEGKVFAMTSGGTYAIDLERGTQLWYRPDLIGNASAAYSDGFIYVQNSLPPTVYKLNAADGKTVWGPVTNCQDDNSCTGESSPIVVGDTVYVGMENNLREASFNVDDANGARGGVLALNAETGAKRWLYFTIPDANPSGENGAAVWSSIGVDAASAMVFATTGNNYTVAGPNGDAFHAVDMLTGMRLWTHQVRTGDIFSVALALAGGDNSTRDFDFGANPILAEFEGRQLVAAGDKGGSFWALDRHTGELLWSRDDLSPSHDATFGGVFINGGFDGRAFYVISNDPKSGGAVLHRLDPAQGGKSTWMHAFKESTWGALALANGLLFAPNNAILYVMNAETGELLKTIDTGGTIAGGSPAIAEGRVVVQSGFIYTDPATKPNDKIVCYALPEAPSTAGGAGSSGTAGAGGSGGAVAPAANSFSAVYRDVIVNTGCNSGQCHSGFAAGALDMSTQTLAYANLVGVQAMGMSAGNAAVSCKDSGLTRVVPGDPARSLLVSKLEHTATCGDPMPNASTTLPREQLQAIRSWIERGAPND